MNRRHFLALAGTPLFAARELRCDVAIIGAGVGGCAAALGALRNGMSVILTEETDWIGGQLTSQAVPPDEHRWIEAFGSTDSYRSFRAGVRDYYRHNYPLTAETRSRAVFNPGGGFVSNMTAEPRVFLAVLQNMLAAWLSGGQLTLLLRHKPVAADINGDKIRSITLRSLESGVQRTINAPYFLDATELGDLLPLTRTEYVTGSESRRQTGEPHAPESAQPANVQAFSICFAIDHGAGENNTIDKPEEYAFWRDYVPALHPPWPGKLLSWTTTDPRTLQPRGGKITPERDDLIPGTGLDYWFYRRIVARRRFLPGTISRDVTLVNWPQNDYLLGTLIDVSEAEAAKQIHRAKQLSLSLLYWMQTEFPGIRLCPGIVGTEDGLAKYPYIRESRRIQAEFTVLEQHVASEGRTAAEPFADSVGVGSYRIDLHPTTGGDNYIDVGSLPFQIPLGALIPKRVENLLPACKNLGVTHITNGCYRLHPVEWNIGEAAGCLAAQAIQTRSTPRQIRNSATALKQFQSKIQAQGVEIAWPNMALR